MLYKRHWNIKNLERGVSYLERAVEGKCLHLSEARRQLVDLYSKGYGGPDAKEKWAKFKKKLIRATN